VSDASFEVVFVCTGNRFRSPLAAALFGRATAGLPVSVSSRGTLDEMLRTFVAGAAEADTTKQTISGKQFTLLKWPGDVRYNYVSGNTMYGLLPADASEAEALARQLP
jgi:hypothetical protein